MSVRDLYISLFHLLCLSVLSLNTLSSVLTLLLTFYQFLQYINQIISMEQFYSAFWVLIFNWSFSHINTYLPKIKLSLKPIPSPLTTCHPPNISAAEISHVLGELSGRETLPSLRCQIFRVVFLLCTIWNRFLKVGLPNLEGARMQTQTLVNTCDESVWLVIKYTTDLFLCLMCCCLKCFERS